MNKQVKININGKDYYCDMEVLKLIERLQDKVELLEYNRDKAIEYIEENCMFHNENNEECYFRYGDALSPKKLVDILKGSEE